MHDAVDARPTTINRWIVVNAQPQRERIAVENLDRQGFETYCPWVRKIVKHARRSSEVLRPLFPGYIFVAFDARDQRWRPLLSTRGVRSVVRCGDSPSFIGVDFIAALRAREVHGAISRPTQAFRVGQEVRIASGALDGLIGTIVEMDEKARLVVLLELLNRPVRIKLGAELLAETASR